MTITFNNILHSRESFSVQTASLHITVIYHNSDLLKRPAIDISLGEYYSQAIVAYFAYSLQNIPLYVDQLVNLCIYFGVKVSYFCGYVPYSVGYSAAMTAALR